MTEHEPGWRRDTANGYPTSDDPFVTYDAAYVLGALSPEERAAYEEHLKECDSCSRAVLDAAGMPGLLAQGRATPGWGEPPPETLLPRLLGQVGFVRRRNRVGLISAVGTAVAACVVAVLTLFFAPEPVRIGDAGTEMTAVQPAPVRARANLVGMSGGTRVEMSCSYKGGEAGDYLLVAIRENGAERTLATWSAIPQDTARMSIGTTLPRADIRALEIRLPDGTPVLRLQQ